LSHNVFAYCLNNPVNYYDPNGNDFLSALINAVVNTVKTIVNTVTAVVNTIVNTIVNINNQVDNSIKLPDKQKKVFKQKAKTARAIINYPNGNIGMIESNIWGADLILYVSPQNCSTAIDKLTTYKDSLSTFWERIAGYGGGVVGLAVNGPISKPIGAIILDVQLGLDISHEIWENRIDNLKYYMAINLSHQSKVHKYGQYKV
jgi:hypothetical protein